MTKINSPPFYIEYTGSQDKRNPRYKVNLSLANLCDSTFLPIPALITAPLTNSHFVVPENEFAVKEQFSSLRRCIENSEIQEIPPTYNFPPKKELKNCLLETSSFLKLPYLVEKKVSDTVTDLAAERFGGSEFVEDGVTIGTILLVDDLKKGTDGYTGKPLPKIQVRFNTADWWVLEKTMKEDLKKCAE